MIAAACFSALHPEKGVKFLNRGIAGNRIRDLRNRWKRDCLNLRPDVVSILIGINDAGKRHSWSRPTLTEDFEADYRYILEQTERTLGAKTVLLEPFLLNVSRNQLDLRKELDPKIEVVKNLSEEFNAILVPLDTIFSKATERREPSFWSQDGIHRTPAGHAMTAKSWLEAVDSNFF
jgi:lysophospholipase L1-like esterase